MDNRTEGEPKGNFVKRLKSIVILFRTLLKEWSFSYSIYADAIKSWYKERKRSSKTNEQGHVLILKDHLIVRSLKTSKHFIRI